MLSGEKNYNKRIFLYAKLVNFDDEVIELEVKIDQFYHEQGW